MKQDRADAIVVGSGASGGIVAKELATAGFSVVLLERGHGSNLSAISRRATHG